MKEIINTPIDHSNPDAVAEKLANLSNILGYLVEEYAKAERNLNTAKGEVLQKIGKADRKYSPTEMKELFNTECKDEIYQVTLIDGYISASRKIMDALVQIISKYKIELEKGI